MFFPAKHNYSITLVLRAFSLCIAMFLLVLTTTSVHAMSNPEISASFISSEEHQTDTLYELTLAYNCQGDSMQEWTVGNTNSFEISYEWFLSTGESGSGIAPALGTDSFLTANSEQIVTIKYTFPQKEVCGDEKCGETEIIKLSLASSICPLTTQGTNSSNNLTFENQAEEKQVMVYSHQSIKNLDTTDITRLTLPEYALKSSTFHALKVWQQWLSTQMLSQVVFYSQS